jgi:hypothetical protein
MQKEVVRWRPGKIHKACFLGGLMLPDRTKSTNSPRHPVHLCICARHAFNIWVFSLLICSVRLGRSAVGCVLKYVRTQKDPHFQNGSSTGRTTGARICDATAPRCEKRDIEYNNNISRSGVSSNTPTPPIVTRAGPKPFVFLAR